MKSAETLVAANGSIDDLEKAHDLCREIAHRFGANFSVGFRFLPRAKRRAVYAAYAFCRFADDIADEEETRDIDTRLTSWEGELDRCYAGAPTHPIAIALADSLRGFSIPKDAFEALIAGCRQDLVKKRYADFRELEHYCDLVATSIADISLSIFGYRGDDTPALGRNLATALQLTNIVRDIGDDVSRGRIYLPAEDLARFGVTEEELLARRATPAVKELIEFEIDRALSFFLAAEPLLQRLDRDARFPTLLMGAIYVAVLKKLRRNPLVALERRVSLSRIEKLTVVARAFFRPRYS